MDTFANRADSDSEVNHECHFIKILFIIMHEIYRLVRALEGNIFLTVGFLMLWYSVVCSVDSLSLFYPLLYFDCMY